MHLVTRGHFRSCDKDGGLTIRIRKPIGTRKLYSSYVL